MSPIEFINNLLTRHNINKPDGRPLYSYNLSSKDYDALRQILKSHKVTVKNTHISALFILYCSEWFRREYESLWSWEPIFETLGGTKVSQVGRTEVVVKGLSFWRRRVIQYDEQRKSLLGSVFREGGLPFKVIRTQGSKFLNVFKRVSKCLDLAISLNQSKADVIKNELKGFPEAFKQPTTISLIEEMLESIDAYVRHYNLHLAENPIEFLNDNQPGWKDKFPIPLDDETGKEIISSLFKSASEKLKAQSKVSNEIKVSYELLDINTLNFNTKIEFPRELTKIKIDKTKVHGSRVEVHIRDGSKKQTISSGFLTAEDNDIEITVSNFNLHLRTTNTVIKRNTYNDSLYLEITQAGRVIYYTDIPNSALMLLEEPVGLIDESGTLIVCGQGMISKKASQMSVIIPLDAQLLDEMSDGYSIELYEGHKLVTFSGEIYITIDDCQYKVTTNLTRQFLESDLLQGKKLNYRTATGRSAFLGIPQPTNKSFDGVIDLYVGNEIFDNSDKAKFFGTNYVKFTKDGTTLLRRKVSVLPPDFKVELIPGDKPIEGAIKLESSYPFIASVLEDSLETKVESNKSGKLLYLKAEAYPPKAVNIRIQPNLQSEPVDLKINFPSSGVLAVHNNDLPLEKHLVVDDLLGSYIYLFPKLNSTAIYHVELIADPSIRNCSYFWRYVVKEEPVIISMYDLRYYVRELLALTGASLDSTVRLRIEGDCDTIQFYIQRYSALLNYKNDMYCLELLNSFQEKSAAPILIRLSDPMQSPLRLLEMKSEGVPTGNFRLPRYDDNHSSLVVPSPESLSFRPSLVQSTNRLDTGNNNALLSLYKAVDIYDPNDNRDVIKTVVEQMVLEPNSSNWDYLKDLFENYSYLPMSTFHVWKEVVFNKAALCHLCFNPNIPVEIVKRLSDEFLIVWETIPLSLWHDSLSILSEKLFVSDLEQRILLLNRLNLLAGLSPIFTENNSKLLFHEYIAESQGAGYKSKVPDEALMILSTNSIKELRKGKEDFDQWPQAYSDDLKLWYNSQPFKLFGSNHDESDDKSVVYTPYFISSLFLGKANLNSVGNGQGVRQKIFNLKQIADFDQRWYVDAFGYGLLSLLFRN